MLEHTDRIYLECCTVQSFKQPICVLHIPNASLLKAWFTSSLFDARPKFTQWFDNDLFTPYKTIIILTALNFKMFIFKSKCKKEQR